MLALRRAQRRAQKPGEKFQITRIGAPVRTRS
ncbi:hypothetical protein GGD55_003988 [Rhizobium giardinii]|uniref:Uncharacterized protein n=1 Tax=Rhizobium giardinii TaxID=56731 RepID=A0A7W8XA32_9HYPH|nr:hypothetical protein [Rhizobium giardinii]